MTLTPHLQPFPLLTFAGCIGERCGRRHGSGRSHNMGGS